MKAVKVIEAHRLRFVLHAPWPDFITVYSALASGVGWIVPKQYLAQVGDEGFRKHPIELGPYRFVCADPGVGLVLEAYDRYWRKTPAIHRLILKGVPDPSIRLAMLKTGELDMAGLPPDEAAERDRATRATLLHRMQSLMHEHVMHGPLLERVALHGLGPRVEEPAVGLIPLAPFAGPYEDMRLKRP